VVSGGLGCLLTTGWISAVTPQLRRYRTLSELPELPKLPESPELK